MKKIILSVVLTIVLTVIVFFIITICRRHISRVIESDLPPISEEEAITYIIENYTVLNDKFIQNYVKTDFPTNEYIIDRLSQYDTVHELTKIGEHLYEVDVGDVVLDVFIQMENNKIIKLLVKEE